jgi:hypothetical protein
MERLRREQMFEEADDAADEYSGDGYGEEEEEEEEDLIEL